MPSQIGKLKYIFLIVLGLCSAAIVSYGWFYDIPKRKCDAAQGWYSWKAHKCYAPIAISTITQRKNGEPSTVDYHDDARKASNARSVNNAVNSAATSR